MFKTADGFHAGRSTAFFALLTATMSQSNQTYRKKLLEIDNGRDEGGGVRCYESHANSIASPGEV